MKRRDSFVLQNLGGESLLVPLGAQVVDTNGMVILNTTGRCIWELLDQDRSADELAAAVAGSFDVDFERARSDVRSFLDDIERIGLLEK